MKQHHFKISAEAFLNIPSSVHKKWWWWWWWWNNIPQSFCWWNNIPQSFCWYILNWCCFIYHLNGLFIELTTVLLLFRMPELYHCPDQTKIQNLKDVANKLRILSIKCTNAAGSGYVFVYLFTCLVFFFVWTKNPIK